MDETCQSTENQNANRNSDSRGQAVETSTGIKDSTGSWTDLGHVCYTLAEKLPAICLGFESVSET